MAPAQDNERAAAILERRAQGLLALDEALAELADANCIVTIAAVIAERIRVQPDVVARSLDAESDEEISVICRAAGFSPAINQEASGISALGLVAAGLGMTVVAASYQALTLDGVRFVPIAGHQLALQVAWAAGNTSTALPAFLETARLIARQTDPVPAAGPQAREP